MNSVRPILHIGEYSLVALQYQRIRYIGLRVSADTDRPTSRSHIKLPLHRLATRHVNETQVFFSLSRERNFSTSENRDYSDRPTVGLWSPVLGGRPGAGRRSRSSVVLHVCILTGVPWRRRPGRCPPFCAPILPRRRMITQRRPTRRGGAARRFPRPSSGGRSAIGPLRVPGRVPPVAHPQPFCDVLGAPPPAMSIDRWGPGIGWEQRWGPAGDCPLPLPLAPAGDPTPITPVNGTCTRAKSTVSIETRELRLLTHGIRFPWN